MIELMAIQNVINLRLYNSPPLEGWQAKPDGVVLSSVVQFSTTGVL
jgi:hypothetical protein